MFVSEYSQVLKAETTLKPVRIFRVVLLFSYQRTLSLSVSSCRSQQWQLIYISIISFVCQELFLTFFQNLVEPLCSQVSHKFQTSYRTDDLFIVSRCLNWFPLVEDVLYNNMSPESCQQLFKEFFLFSKNCLQFIPDCLRIPDSLLMPCFSRLVHTNILFRICKALF